MFLKSLRDMGYYWKPIWAVVLIAELKKQTTLVNYAHISNAVKQANAIDRKKFLIDKLIKLEKFERVSLPIDQVCSSDLFY